jgi:uncharacterized protein (DUF58 family)
MKPAKNYFDPQILARINGLLLRARLVVDGLLLGIHKSRAKGFSSDFEEYREYSPGDDVRHLDWKAYGKFDRYFIKEFRRTTNLKAQILLDVSRSMDYASDGVTKFDYGCLLAASLAYMMIKQQDAVGLFTFNEKVMTALPARARQGHLSALVEALEGSRPQGRSAAGPVLQQLAAGLAGRGLVVLISDLLDDPEEVLNRFEDLEEDLKLLTDPRAIRKTYLKAVSSLIDTYRDGCSINSVDYVLLNTSTPLDKALVSYLSWRDKGIFNP